MRGVLVAGGSGLVGRKLLAALAERGLPTTLLSRRRSLEGLPAGVVLATWDELTGALGNADAVVNLSGEGIAEARWSRARRELLVRSRVESTTRLVELMAQLPSPPAVLVNASAVGYYGPRGTAPVDEGTPAGSGFLAELCRAWEAAADGAGALGTRVVKLRIGIVLAREGGALPRMAAPVRAFLGSPLGDGRQGMPWIHVDDLVAMILAALEDPAWSGPVNATAPEPVANAAFTRLLGRVLHRPVLPVPGFLTRTVLRAVLGDLAEELLLSGAFVQPRRAMELGFRYRHPGLEEALRDLLSPAPPGGSGAPRP